MALMMDGKRGRLGRSPPGGLDRMDGIRSMLRRRRYGLSAFHPSERVEEILQVLGHCSAPGQVFIRDCGWAHSNDDRPNMLVLPELPGIGPLRRDQAAVPVSLGLQQSVSLSYGCHG